MKRIEKAIIIALIFSVIVGSFSAFASECNDIRDSVLRLHILANSDSAEDQALKLKVRDRILAETGNLFQDARDLKNAENKVSESLALVKQIAEDEIQKQGYHYDVNAELCNMFFACRSLRCHAHYHRRSKRSKLVVCFISTDVHSGGATHSRTKRCIK